MRRPVSPPRIPRPRLPRVRLPRPPEAVIEAGRVPVELGREGWDWWLGLSIYTRRRLGVAAGLLAVIALIWLAAIPALPCGAPGGESCPPRDHAIGLVPDDALAYAHVNLDRGSDQFKAAEDVASRVPTLAQQAIGRLAARLPGPHGAPLDFDRDIEPWFGGEAAVAILPAGGRAAQEVQLLGVGDEDGARRFADSIASGGLHSLGDQGTDLQVDRRGLATALVGGFLVIGTKSGVRAVIGAHGGADDAGSLAADPAADAARDALPEERLADVYLSKDGIARLVADPESSLATLAPVINPGASEGVAAALVASDDGLELDIRSILDPARVPAHPGFFGPPLVQAIAAGLPPARLARLPGDRRSGQDDRVAPGAGERLASRGSRRRPAGSTESLKGLGNLDLERELAPAARR